MSYLILTTAQDALARSERAWLDCGYATADTARLWPVVSHPTSGHAALKIAATPSDAQINLPQATYDALLTDDERAELLMVLPDDWTVDEI